MEDKKLAYKFDVVARALNMMMIEARRDGYDVHLCIYKRGARAGEISIAIEQATNAQPYGALFTPDSFRLIMRGDTPAKQPEKKKRWWFI